MNEQWKRYAELELREREFEIALKSIQQEKAALKEDYNANSLSSYVRGLAAEDDPDMAPVDIEARMPEPLRAVCSVGEVWQIGARKG